MFPWARYTQKVLNKITKKSFEGLRASPGGAIDPEKLMIFISDDPFWMCVPIETYQDTLYQILTLGHGLGPEI